MLLNPFALQRVLAILSAIWLGSRCIQLFYAFMGSSQINCSEMLWTTKCTKAGAARPRMIVHGGVHSTEGQKI